MSQGRRQSSTKGQLRAEAERERRNAPRVAAYHAVHTLHAQGTPIVAIARAVSFAMVRPAAKRSADAQRYLGQLCHVDTRMARAQTLIQAFLALVRERRGDDLKAWMAEATRCGIEALARFARGRQDDLSAITAGLTLEWSNGATRPDPSPEAPEAPGLWAGWLCALTATRPHAA
jgi:hypothetical protein